MPDIHSKLSPSSTHRWLHCNAALAAEQFEPNLSTLLATNPAWALDLPLSAGGFEAYRYKKD